MAEKRDNRITLGEACIALVCYMCAVVWAAVDALLARLSRNKQD
jgi:hypothetical protein